MKIWNPFKKIKETYRIKNMEIVFNDGIWELKLTLETGYGIPKSINKLCSQGIDWTIGEK